MPDVMKTLLLNPPSFENFDGGASSRWPATREIESYWYPVWLTYPAGMIPGSRLLDASPAKVNWQQTVQICKDYEFLVLFTSTVGFASDVKLIRKIKEANPRQRGHRFRDARGVRPFGGGVRAWQAAQRDSERQLSQGRQDHA